MGFAKIQKEFEKISKFDKWLVRLINTRKETSGILFEQVKKNPAALTVFVVGNFFPFPIGTIMMSPFIAWYFLAPTPKMKDFRKTLSAVFNQDINYQKLKSFIKNGENGIKYCRKKAFSYLADDIWIDTQTTANKTLNFVRRKLGRNEKKLKLKDRFRFK